MPLLRPNPSFYPSLKMVMQAPLESLAVVNVEPGSPHILGESPETYDAWIQSQQQDIDSAEHLEAVITFLSATGNATRLRMLYALSHTSELCVGDLAQLFQITSPAISRHLKKLRQASLVESRREAQTIYYSISKSNRFVLALLQFFEEPHD